MKISSLIILCVAVVGVCALIWTYGYPTNPLSRDGFDGKAALENKKYNDALLLLDRACTVQDLEACSNLGIMHEDGLATKRDISRANALYEKACSGGNAAGCTLLGISFEKGNGVKRDQNRAMELYARACDSKNGAGCVNLGRIQHELGNYFEAASFFERGCNAGSWRGCNDLATMRVSGYGGQVDLKSAHLLLEKSCRLGSGEGCNYAGLNVWNGTGVTQNFEDARFFFQKACKAKYNPICENLNREKSLAEIMTSNAIEAERKKILHGSLIAILGGLVLGIGFGKLIDFDRAVNRLSVQILENIAEYRKYSLLEVQNIIRPRWLILIAIVIPISALGIVVYSVLNLTTATAALSVLIFLSCIWISRKFIPPKAEDQILIEWIYSNVQNRYANFVRDKDTVRAMRFQDVLSVIQSIRENGMD